MKSATEIRLPRLCTWRSKSMKHRIRALAFITTLLFVVTGLAMPSAQADTSATIGVTASIGQPATLSVTVCDPTTNFGSNIGFHGTLPVGGDPGIVVTNVGNDQLFYVWSAQCTPAISATSNVPYTLHLCGSENAGGSVTLAGNDLRYDRDAAVGTPALATFNFWSGEPSVAACSANPPPIISTFATAPFNYSAPLNLALRMQSGDPGTGTFSSTLTFSVSPS
jgi:hypothetical protein